MRTAQAPMGAELTGIKQSRVPMPYIDNIDNINTCLLVPKSVLEMLARTLVKMTLGVQCSYQRMEGEIKYSIDFLGG